MYGASRIGELLVTAGLIDQATLRRALELQVRDGGKLGEVLVRELVLTEDQIATALAQQTGYRHVNLASIQLDPVAAMLLPLRTARRRSMVPIGLSDGALVLAMSDPLDVEAVDEAELITGMKVEPVVAPATQVRNAIEKYVAGPESEVEFTAAPPGSYEEEHALADAESDATGGVTRIVNHLIRQAIQEEASDIHVEPGSENVRVRYRVDGVMREAAVFPKTSQAMLISRLKVMAEMDITERRKPQDGRVSIRVDDRALDLRVATLPTPQGETVTLRILNSAVAVHHLSELGLGAKDEARVRRMLARPYGAILVTGPTGSGKTTTLYSFLREIASPDRKTITIEDPIEFRMDAITQIAVNARVGLTFSTGLRTILRSDPDIVMVGEIRDGETAAIATRAALTGHLVLSSLHTNDSVAALVRLTDMGVEPFVTASSLIGVVAQRLVRRLCSNCKRVQNVPASSLIAAGFSPDEIRQVVVWEPVGCEECGGTGYHGRVAVFELLEFDDRLRDAFLAHARVDELRTLATGEGMLTLRDDALGKVRSGITSLAEMERVVV